MQATSSLSSFSFSTTEEGIVCIHLETSFHVFSKPLIFGHDGDEHCIGRTDGESQVKSPGIKKGTLFVNSFYSRNYSSDDDVALQSPVFPSILSSSYLKVSPSGGWMDNFPSTTDRMDDGLTLGPYRSADNRKREESRSRRTFLLSFNLNCSYKSPVAFIISLTYFSAEQVLAIRKIQYFAFFFFFSFSPSPWVAVANRNF